MKLRINYQGNTYITKEFESDKEDLKKYTLKDLNNYILNTILKRKQLSLKLENGNILIMDNEALKRSVFIIEE
jgi:hypothetical protein